jgi:hypothetical protein
MGLLHSNPRLRFAFRAFLLILFMSKKLLLFPITAEQQLSNSTTVTNLIALLSEFLNSETEVVNDVLQSSKVSPGQHE